MLFKGSPWLPKRIVEIFEEIPKLFCFSLEITYYIELRSA